MRLFERWGEVDTWGVMKFTLRSNGVPRSGALRTFVEDRLEHAFGRFADRIRRVRVQFTDVNGPRGGEDIECRVQATVAGGGQVIVHELRADPYAAVARACDRASQQLARRLERFQERRRGRGGVRWDFARLESRY